MTLIRHMSMSVRVRLRKLKHSYIYFGLQLVLNHYCEMLEIVVDRIWPGKVRALNFGVFSADFRRARALLQLIAG